MRVPGKPTGAALFLAALAAVAAVALFAPDQEPRCKGRSLSYWLMRIGNSPWKRPDPEALQAFRAIGTNGLPWLLSWAGSEPQPTGVRKLAKPVLEKAPEEIAPGFLRRWANRRYEQERAGAAGYAIHLLGAQAEPAIPELYKLLSAPATGNVRFRAAHALALMGPVVQPIFLTNLTNPHAPRGLLAVFFGLEPALTTNATAGLVRPLARCLGDGDPGMQAGAAFSLGQLGLEPEVAVPALIACLDASPGPRVRQNAVSSLQRFGSAARAAEPALVRLLRDQDVDVRMCATNALRAIAPEMLTNSPAAPNR